MAKGGKSSKVTPDDDDGPKKGKGGGKGKSGKGDKGGGKAGKKGGKVGGSRENRLEDAAARFAKGKERREARAASRRQRMRKYVSPWKQFVKLFSNRKEVVINSKTRTMARALMLTMDEMERIKDVYDSVDVDGAGEMDFDEFFEMLGEPRTPFTDAIFTLIDNVENTGVELLTARERAEIEREDGPGTALYVRGFLTFDDFAQSIMIFAMYGQDDILLFGFNAFDADNSGVIDENEYMALCLIINDDKPKYPDNFKLALATFDKNTDGMMDFQQFKTCNDRFPLTLFPAFRFQDKIRSKVLGQATWVDISRRIEEEKERETYRRAHNGAEMPRTPVQVLCDFLSRQRQGNSRVRKPPTAQETAVKKAALTKNKQADTQVQAAEQVLRREGRGAKSVGTHKMGKLKLAENRHHQTQS